MISRHTILYAEDDFDDVLIVKEAFEKHDHIEVIHAVNGADALHKLQEMHSQGILPCLIILDINMPVMDGKEALQKIKSNPLYRDVPVVLFSTSSSLVDSGFAGKWQVELVTKPLSYEDLEHIALEFVNRCNFEINKLSRASNE